MSIEKASSGGGETPESQERIFSVGEVVKVKRTSGAVEQDWVVSKIDNENGIVRVQNEAINLFKDVPIEELKDWQNLGTTKWRVKMEPSPFKLNNSGPVTPLEGFDLTNFEQSEEHRKERLKRGLTPISELDVLINQAETFASGDERWGKLLEERLENKRRQLAGEPVPSNKPSTQTKPQRQVSDR